MPEEGRPIGTTYLDGYTFEGADGKHTYRVKGDLGLYESIYADGVIIIISQVFKYTYGIGKLTSQGVEDFLTNLAEDYDIYTGRQQGSMTKDGEQYRDRLRAHLDRL